MATNAPGSARVYAVLSSDEAERLDAIAESEGISRSAVVRRALRGLSGTVPLLASSSERKVERR